MHKSGHILADMNADNPERELEEHRREFLEYLEMVQPTELPDKAHETRCLKSGFFYKPYDETAESSTNGPVEDR